MNERDRQNPYWNEEQDWRERERDRSWRREGQQQSWRGRPESQWTPESGYRSQGAFSQETNDFERNQAQRGYVFGEQHGTYRGQEGDYGRYESQTGYGGGGGYGPGGQHSGYAGGSSQERYGSGWQSGYGAGQQSRVQRRGPKGYTRSDERIREDVCERLMMSDLDTSDVSVEVRAGTVILDGTVPERRMKYGIEDTAEQCFGVTDVENNIRVSRRGWDASWTGRGESIEVDGLNRCLRSELSAIETYRQALDRDRQQYGAQTEFQRLTEILREHEDSASRLRQVIRQLGGEPSSDAGAWGTWSKIVMGAAKLFGDKAALKALKEGEESGLKEYERCLQEANPSTDVRGLIGELMGRQQRHIRELDSLIAATDRR